MIEIHVNIKEIISLSVVGFWRIVLYTVDDLINKGYSYSEGLPPVVFDKPKTLILGELPGKDSIEAKEYYIKKSNHFWPLLAEIFRENRPVTKEDRYTLLKRHRIALWDVYKSGYRRGSRSPVKQGMVNDIPKFIQENPSIQQIVLAGGWAQEAFEKNYELDIATISVPSTSAANNRYWNDRKHKWFEIDF